MNNLIKDLSTLTTINEGKLENLFKLIADCIGEEFKETIDSEKSIMEYDIAIGKLFICNKENELKYKFIPSENLENILKGVVKGKRNSLELKVEKSLISAIENTYKDLL